jgi:hypothetical protein
VEARGEGREKEDRASQLEVIPDEGYLKIRKLGGGGEGER